MRRICGVHGMELGKRDTLQQINEQLYKKRVYSLLYHKEIIAKAEVGNCAAHGRFNEYKKQDVEDFLAYTQRFLAEYLR